MAAFWRIEHPDYHSDYRDSYINGELEHPFGLPGVRCDVCGATYGGGRILAYECPQSLRQHKSLRERWPIARAVHTRLQQKVFMELGIQGEPFIDLRPGDDFQPCFLDIPSRPRADFLWPCIGSLVVTDRIKDLFLEICPANIAVCPVTLRKIGKQNAKLPPPMPSTGEPEDIINEVQLLDVPPAARNYSEILILNESGFPPGGTPLAVCSGCKRPTIGDNRELRMTPEMWKGQAMFFLSTTLHIVVTDRLRKAIQQLLPTNVEFEPI